MPVPALDTGVLNALHHVVTPFFQGYLALGVGTIIYYRFRLHADLRHFKRLKHEFESVHPGSKSPKELKDWIGQFKQPSLAQWVRIADNSVRGGMLPDAAAITDALWSQERERYSLIRFLARNAIILGLLFTSLGLAKTLFEVSPALQASTGIGEQWVKNVQAAMGQALGGMSLAFTSSLWGLSVNLILSVLELLIFHRAHSRYIKELDTLIQEKLIPCFAFILEGQHRHRFETLKDAISKVSTGLSEVREQYERVLDVQTRQQEALSRASDSLKQSSMLFDNQLKAFGTYMGGLGEAAKGMGAHTKRLEEAIAKGLKAVDETQGRHIKEQKHFQDHVVVPFVARVTNEEQHQRESARALLERFEAAAGLFRAMTEKFAAETVQLTQAQHGVEKAMEKAADSLAVAGESVSQVVATVETRIGGLTTNAVELLQSQVQRHGALEAGQLEVMARLTLLAESFAQTRHLLDKQYNEVYDAHRQQLRQVYQGLQEELETSLTTLIRQAAADSNEFLALGVRQAIGDTHRHLSGLNWEALDALVRRGELAVAELEGGVQRREAEAIVAE